MLGSDPLRIQLAHDRWATRQLIDACGRLTADQFHRRFDIGPGSLHDTVAHVIGAMQTWTQTLAGQQQGPRIDHDGQRRTPEALRELHAAAFDGLSTEAARRPLDEIVARRLRTGREVRMTRGAVLTHVTTHGMHHRAQCLNMLRRLGVDPLPPSSVTEWTILGDGQG
jgi:uncharacterized damage-inducible protein DinB